MTCPNSCRWLEKSAFESHLRASQLCDIQEMKPLTRRRFRPSIDTCAIPASKTLDVGKKEALWTKTPASYSSNFKNSRFGCSSGNFHGVSQSKKKLEYTYSLLYTRYSIHLYTSKYWNDLVNWPYPFRLSRPRPHLIRGPTQRAAQLPAVSLGGRALQASAQDTGHRQANLGINLDGVWRIPYELLHWILDGLLILDVNLDGVMNWLTLMNNHWNLPSVHFMVDLVGTKPYGLWGIMMG